ncbi:MAG: ribonuclease HII [Verrucomicrobia bacterium]|nr:MAG: ribonuclease HII [Verrucomicrobiota bacterium]
MDQSEDRFRFERELLAAGCRRIAGVDEAGRGPLAGPVVAAAVVFPAEMIRRGLPPELAGLNDSKQVAPARREAWFAFLMSHPEIECGIAEASPEEIDRLNILRATHLAMARALGQLRSLPEHTLVDGRPAPSLPGPQTALVRGDARSFSIAAASILAKVTRDRLMCRLDEAHPGYGFARHKGYPTPAHLEALRRLGPCPAHRRSFAPVQARLEQLSLGLG